MYIDFKVTCWERVKIDDSIKDDVLNKLKLGVISSSSDLFDHYSDELFTFDNNMDDTAEQMSVEENNGMSTIEVFEANFLDLWNNKSETK